MNDITAIDNIFLRTTSIPSSKGDVWFIHGYGESGLSFRELLSTDLAENFNLFVPDFPGFGVSPYNPSCSNLEQCQPLLIQLIQSLSENTPVYLIAHSLGSILGTWVASELQDRVEALFSIEGNLTEADAFFSAMGNRYDDPQQFYRDFIKHIEGKIQTSDALQRYYASVRFAHPEALMGWSRSAIFSNVEKCGRAFLALKCRTLYYWGEESTSSETKSFLQAERIPNLTFEGSGHWPMVDQPHQTAEAISNFLLQT